MTISSISRLAILGLVILAVDAATPKETFATIRARVAQALGAEWSNDSFVCILAEAEAMDAKSKAVAGQIGKTLREGGVTNALDLSFARTKPLLDQIAIKIMWFGTADEAAEFFRKKYREHQDFSEIARNEVVGKTLGKRARLVGTTCISVFKLTRDDESTAHHLALACEELQKSMPPPP